MSNQEDALLEKQVLEFSNDLIAACKAFTGESPELAISSLKTGSGDVITIRLQQDEGELRVIPLRSRGFQVIGVTFEFRCTWDSTSRYLAVEKSSIAVYPFADAEKQPLFRVEYLRNQDSHRPSSHFHVHAHRDEFTHLMSFATRLDVEKQGKVKDYFRKGTHLSQFHFPTGGHRFRPCFEDILEVLRVEFKLDVDNNVWIPHLKSARVKWRRAQTAAVVRDDPQEAFRVLVDQFGMPKPAEWVCPGPDVSKLSRS